VKMSMPKPDQQTKELFAAVVPNDPRVTTRPMFGNLAAFVNGNMFAGLFGNDLFVRLPEDVRADLITQGIGTPFEPMPGRPMREYVVLPKDWQATPDRLREWTDRAMQTAAILPMKTPGGSKARKKTQK
jgi:TfoX/Sxy family transcriptional regulator of competence genes